MKRRFLKFNQLDMKVIFINSKLKLSYKVEMASVNTRLASEKYKNSKWQVKFTS